MKDLSTLSVKELKNIAKDYDICGRSEMKKKELINAIERVHLIKEAEDLGIRTAHILNNNQLKEVIKIESENQAKEKRDREEKIKEKKRSDGRVRIIKVFKDGQPIKEIYGLMETFRWVVENNITNVGWVKRSLKTGEETKPGYKYRTGGYRFQYVNKRSKKENKQSK